MKIIFIIFIIKMSWPPSKIVSIVFAGLAVLLYGTYIFHKQTNEVKADGTSTEKYHQEKSTFLITLSVFCIIVSTVAGLVYKKGKLKTQDAINVIIVIMAVIALYLVKKYMKDDTDDHKHSSALAQSLIAGIAILSGGSLASGDL